MGFTGAGRFLQSAISREWAREYTKNNEAQIDTPTCGSFGYDKTSKAALDRQELGRGWDGSLDEADER
jgi:hypothetical protein